MEDNNLYRKKDIAPHYFRRWVSTAFLVAGGGIALGGTIAKESSLSNFGSSLMVVGSIGLSNELGVIDGEDHFYKTNLLEIENSNLLSKIRDFYIPPKKL